VALVDLRSFGGRVRALRQAKGLSQAELSRQIGRHQTAIGPYERDEYMPARSVVERLAEALDTSPEYLYFGRSPQQTAIPLAGRVGAAGEVRLAEAGADAAATAEGGAEARAPAATVTIREHRLMALRVADTTMRPVLSPGQTVLVAAAAERDVDAHLGRLVLAELGDGRRFLRRLLPSARRGRHDLAAFEAPTMREVEVARTNLVVGVLEPEAASED